MFNGLLIEKDDQGYRASLQQLDKAQLPEGDVTVKVQYSSINYKDGLAITGKSPVVRQFPMVPGIDFVGVVEHSESDKWQVGDKVLLNGFGVGETHWGGLAQYAKVKSDWLIALPESMDGFSAMAVGTAGYTAMLCVMALESNGVTPAKGPILVTGANGGVGSFAIAMLAKLGFDVVASTGRVDQAAYLSELGASEVIDRNTLSEPGRPLAKERWAGVVDSVGSHTLANACASTQYGGTVAACGLAQGFDLPATVMPFILRGVNLAGVDSVMRPIADREIAWNRIADLIDAELISKIATEISLDKVIETADALLAGTVQGRVVVKLD
ncbi:oxidoreductase [Shewanella maritima]|uniref:Oxidoreductase n=1 Tax=Shewanella maritima TaxID=2520507 RepID=A0A411PJW7_9GAMM|nr:MDR family oxidoreductase [Shewanella maritima]QBF83833.1 oxidoreductase [Shewanella maritima]